MENLTKLTDTDLLTELSNGNTFAFVEIYNRYHAQLYSSSYKRLQNADEAEEAVQDLFTNLWLNRATLHIHTSLVAYLFTALRNIVLNQIQKNLVRKRYLESIEAIQTNYDNSTQEAISFNELNQKVELGIQTLPEKCRSVFELSRKQYKSNKQIAFELGISEKTVENHITKALRHLRVGLQHIILLLIFLN